MKLPHYIAQSLFTMLLPLAFFSITTHAQQTARIKLESLDKFASKAAEMVRKEEKAKGGDDMVYVRCFEFKQAGDYKEADLQEVRAQLQLPGWSLLMKVNDRDHDSVEKETTEIYVFGRTAGSKIFGGMAIIATEPKELTVVNIVGQGNIDEIMGKAKQTKPLK
jgi:hypothetical protein